MPKRVRKPRNRTLAEIVEQNKRPPTERKRKILALHFGIESHEWIDILKVARKNPHMVQAWDAGQRPIEAAYVSQPVDLDRKEPEITREPEIDPNDLDSIESLLLALSARGMQLLKVSTLPVKEFTLILKSLVEIHKNIQDSIIKRMKAEEEKRFQAEEKKIIAENAKGDGGVIISVPREEHEEKSFIATEL